MSEPISISLTSDAGRVRVRGDLDIAGAPVLAAALRHMSHPHPEISLAEVTFIDSSGLRELMRAWHDHNAIVVDVPPVVLSKILRTGLDPVLGPDR